MNASFSRLQSQTKYLEQSKQIDKNWTDPGYFDICRFKLFHCYFLSFICGRENRRRFQANLIFHNFLRLLRSFRSETRETTCIQIFYTR